MNSEILINILGILKCFKEGIVSSVTLLVNMKDTQHAVELSKENNIPVGILLFYRSNNNF